MLLCCHAIQIIFNYLQNIHSFFLSAFASCLLSVLSLRADMMTSTTILTFLVGGWLLGILWGEVWRVITRNWQQWMS